MGALRNTHALSTTLLESRITSYYLRPSDTKKKKTKQQWARYESRFFNPKIKFDPNQSFSTQPKTTLIWSFSRKRLSTQKWIRHAYHATVPQPIFRCEQYNSRERTNANNCKKWSSQDKREHNQANTELYGFSTSSIYLKRQFQSN